MENFDSFLLGDNYEFDYGDYRFSAVCIRIFRRLTQNREGTL